MGAKPDERRIAWTAPLVAAALVLAALVHLSPEYLYHWDEIQLSLGAERFDPAWHQPHPPGYYLFVLVSRLIGALLPDALEPGRVVSALAAAAFVALLGTRLPAGLALAPRLLLQLTAALFVVACPLVAFFALANLTYVAEGVLWTWIALLVSARPRGRGLLALALLVGVAAGVRPTLLLWSMALCGLEWLRRPGWIRARDLVPCGVALCAGLLAWLLPMLHEAGGVARYVEAAGLLGAGNVWSKSVFALGPAVLLERLPAMLSDLAAAGGWALVPALARLAPGVADARSEPARSRQIALLAAAGISFGFYALVIYDSAGYALSFVLPVAAFGIFETGRLARDLGSRPQTLATLGLVLLMLPWTWLSRSPEISLDEYATHDRNLRSRFDALRRFDPDTTLLVTSEEYWRYGFRHVMYYLPEYTTLQLVRDPFFVGTGEATPYLTARHRRVWASGPDGVALADLRPFRGASRLERLVYVVPFDAPRYLPGSCLPFLRALDVGNGEQMAVLPVDASLSVRVRAERLHCTRSASPGRAGADEACR
jgi:hypothetical protein